MYWTKYLVTGPPAAVHLNRIELDVSSVNFKSVGPPKEAENESGTETDLSFFVLFMSLKAYGAIVLFLNTVAQVGATGRRTDTRRQRGQQRAEILKLLNKGGELASRR